MSKNCEHNNDIKIGMRFSKCVVKAFDYRNENNKGKKTRKKVAICVCDCGEEFVAYLHRLRKGSTSSCGPCKKKLNGSLKVIDLTGRRFERLVVKEKAPSNSEGQARWLCVCDCGNEIETTGKLLRTKQTKSCGCLRTDNAKQKRNKLEGKQCGLLTVLKYLGKSNYLCRCQCGSDISKPSQGLVENTVSLDCGSPICQAESHFVGPILSLSDAVLNGLRHYSDGKRCRRGHNSSKLVSTMSCLICHREIGREYSKNNADKVREYDRAYKKSDQAKRRRNKQLKHRRESDLPYRYSESLRSRLSKVLGSIDVEKPRRSSRLQRLQDVILIVLRRQSLTLADINTGLYELDHILPLASFPWSKSMTANALVEMEANSPNNLQFITVEDHQAKTIKDGNKYGWYSNSKVYVDHSDTLIEDIKEGKALPSYLKGSEQKILIELLDAKSKH